MKIIYHHYESWEDAYNFLLAVSSKKIQESQRRIDAENEQFKRLLEMKNLSRYAKRDSGLN